MDENIPLNAGQWDVPGLRGVQKLAATFAAGIEDAKLFRLIATTRNDAVTLPGGIDDIRWPGPTPEFEALAQSIYFRPDPDLIPVTTTATQIFWFGFNG